MAIKFEKVEAGMVLYDRHKYKMGNTNIWKMGEWRVRIISVDHEANKVVASWNGNEPRTMHRRSVEKLHRKSMHDKAKDAG